MRSKASGGWEAKFPLPASQTLIVASSAPETMVFPSGEKATEWMIWSWALAFSLLSSSVAVRGSASQLKEDTSGFGLNACLNPRL